MPLVGRASLVPDRSIIPPGTTLLAEVPLLDITANLMVRYELRLMVALDVGGAIKGQHFDIYRSGRKPDTAPGGTTTMDVSGAENRPGRR